ncbi:hypothetical protein PN467_11360 [Microcystis aeruginosa CS-563/04]|jgi:hypothetical protein|uniref:PEP-CTERM sorting domain-containing protein n=1 Tax=Microcystis aeruginosa Ma_SC_T_19800800_S464 TaxID=2486257 RepID=A0A552DLX7_MICAE|nr:hypothetical protein [Microcystis aeruginosa]MDB9421098.1 hypothetical protein [Microcystis aeruginosa CS-563/04]TRU23209.1 MAG: hypothetical protein EWV81_16600 [Microcystis aeruginosa Ma_SC_T_19800800_S464]
MSIKSSSLTFGFIFGLSSLIFASPSQAALINFSSWNLAGDVVTPALGQVDLSTNALQNDDSPSADNNFNFSNLPAIDSLTLESNLGLPSQSLDPDPSNFVFAFEGSGLENAYTFTEETTLSFNWTFLTNDETRDLSGFDFDDYAFIALNDQIQTLASTNSSISTLIPSSTNFSREVSGSYTQTFSPGTYSIALGVVDVGSFDQTSALIINNAQLSSQSNQPIPESNSLLSLLVPIGFFAVSFFHRR